MAYTELEKTLHKLGGSEIAVKAFFQALTINPNAKCSNFDLGQVLANFKRVSWIDLRVISELFAILDDHLLYESMLLKCDPDLKTTSWLFQDQSVSMAYKNHKPEFNFIHKIGFGANTLNCYRKINIGNIVLFEKVYLSGSDDILKTVWFYDFIYPHLDSNFIQVPKLRAAKFSKQCTILNTNYVEIAGVSKQYGLLRNIELVNYFIELSKSIVL